jgi:hypothetical protein
MRVRVWRVALFGVLSSSVAFCAGHVGVYLQFEVSPSPAVLRSMQQEVARIMDPLGLQFDWRLASQNRGTELFDRVVLVRFDGSCAGTPAQELAPGAEIVLGETVLSGYRVIPYSTVHCARLRSFLFAETRREAHPDLQMGRAMGRVVAHELVHVLLRTRGHDRHGVTRARQSPHDLLENLPAFCKGERERLRHALQRPAGNLVASRGSRAAH